MRVSFLAEFNALPLASHGGDTPLDVPGFMAEWNRRETIPMRFATPVEFAQALDHAAARARRGHADAGHAVGLGARARIVGLAEVGMALLDLFGGGLG